MTNTKMTPDEFAAGARQVLHKEKPAAPSELNPWLARVDEAYPPFRATRTVPVDKPKRGQPTHRTYLESAKNDPFVILFLTDMLGTMASAATAERLYGAKPSDGYQYGVEDCVWAPQDESWSLRFRRDEIEIDCYRRPSEADIATLIFIIGWWTLRTQTYLTRGKWRRMNLTNTGELMRKHT